MMRDYEDLSFTKQDLYIPKKMCGAHTTAVTDAEWNRV